MLRGLVIRRVFMAIELAVVILVLVAGGMVVRALLAPSASETEGSATANPPEEARALLPEAGDKAQYASIVNSGLFGEAGKTAQNEPAPPAPKPEPEPAEEQETELRLKLWGTAATVPKDPLASAIIENEEDGSVRTFFIGQEVVVQVTLEEVHQRKVYLFNARLNRREVLYTEAEKEKTRVASVATARSTSMRLPARPAPPRPAVPDSRVTINRQEFIQELFVNYADLVTKIKPEMYRDETGKVVGITASNIESLPLAQMLDLKEGDVLQTVNNEMIDSEEKVLQLVNKYRNSNVFRVGILRGGSPRVITYRLD